MLQGVDCGGRSWEEDAERRVLCLCLAETGLFWGSAGQPQPQPQRDPAKKDFFITVAEFISCQYSHYLSCAILMDTSFLRLLKPNAYRRRQISPKEFDQDQLIKLNFQDG